VTVSPAMLELNLGTQQVLEAVLRGANGTVLTGRDIAWSSSNAAVASVDAAGRVTAHAQGSATITAASEGRGAIASVTVRDVPAADLLHDSPGQDESHLFRIYLGSGTLSAHSVRIDMSAANDRQAYHPTASPDGSRIAFHNHVLGGDAIFVVNRDGTNLQRLTWMEGRSDAPAWSPVPGANRIAFRHYSTEANRSDIWVMDANGANPRNLTAHLPAGEGRFDPAWSPDGQWIAFAVTRSNGNIQGIWIIRADGTGAREVTSGMNSHANFPSWSPDGWQIAYTRFFYPYSDIVIVDVQTGAERRIARDRHQRSPSWSPDGRHIAFTEDGAVHVMRPDGSQVERIRKGPRDAFRVSWIRRP
jgi:Tol biopolymer transport system component